MFTALLCLFVSRFVLTPLYSSTTKIYILNKEEGATVTRALVAENVHIGKKVKVGSKNSEEIKLVAEDVKGGTK